MGGASMGGAVAVAMRGATRVARHLEQLGIARRKKTKYIFPGPEINWLKGQYGINKIPFYLFQHTLEWLSQKLYTLQGQASLCSKPNNSPLKGRFSFDFKFAKKKFACHNGNHSIQHLRELVNTRFCGEHFICLRKFHSLILSFRLRVEDRCAEGIFYMFQVKGKNIL